MKIAICDDCRTDRIRLLRHINRRRENDIQIYEYESGEKLLEAMADVTFDAIFLDIQMKGMDGNRTAKSIRDQDANVVLVFYTGYIEPTPVTFEVQPYRYIMKNMTEEQIGAYVDAALQKMYASAGMPVLSAKVGRRQVMIRAEHILYVEKYKKGTRLYIPACYYVLYGLSCGRDGFCDEIRFQEKLGSIYERLKTYGFGWPHDSYIINFRYMRSCTTRSLKLEGVDGEFSIARSKAKVFLEQKDTFISSKYVEGGNGK